MRYRCMVMGLWVGLMASFSFSQDLDLTISLPSDTWTECEPVRIIAQLRNHSHQDVKLCCLMPSFLEARTHLIIKGRDTHLPQRNFVPIIPFHHPELILLSTGKSYSYTKYIPANTPGVYTLKAILDLTKNPNPGGEFFTGKLASNLLQYTIQAATGADKLVLAWARNKLELAREKSYFSKIDHCSYVHSAEILDLFPTSTYAAWVLLRKLYGPDPYNVKQWVNPLHPELLCKEPQLKKADAERNLFLIRIVLQHHPDFPFLNHIKKAEICNLNRLDRRNELIKRLAVYRHDPDPITAQWAQFYYDFLTKGKDK